MQKTEQRVSCPEGLWLPLLYHSPPVSATTVHLILFIEEYSFSGGWSDSPRRKTASVLQKESSSTPNHPPSCCTTRSDLGGTVHTHKTGRGPARGLSAGTGGQTSAETQAERDSEAPRSPPPPGYHLRGRLAPASDQSPLKLCRFASQETGLGVLCPWSCHLDPRLGRLSICSAGPWEPQQCPSVLQAGCPPLGCGVEAGGAAEARLPENRLAGSVKKGTSTHPDSLEEAKRPQDGPAWKPESCWFCQLSIPSWNGQLPPFYPIPGASYPQTVPYLPTDQTTPLSVYLDKTGIFQRLWVRSSLRPIWCPFPSGPLPPLFLDLQPPLGSDEQLLALWVLFVTSFWKFRELFPRGGEKKEGRRNLWIMGEAWEQIPSMWELKWSRLSRCQRVPLSSEGSVASEEALASVALGLHSSFFWSVFILTRFSFIWT